MRALDKWPEKQSVSLHDEFISTYQRQKGRRHAGGGAGTPGAIGAWRLINLLFG
jgi:hypothetical protein